ncbi:LacI family DNA-binding transcriptional regulator [Arthrobacter sp. ISL-28]|uniref:LacI family DNA-binding transcriptional regulator n=1 Tax=Arthrobacter sp. ISL-28 TaxID=2819108 RepID=UPI001BEB9E98|nr:LacI family DNA-binding transcriptional regulator [Arthrobacter sp. ISL-28]MBT2522127.1 LacI family DNA-binding transcriptional regulator [Arthrobacter sp. ISL-28]
MTQETGGRRPNIYDVASEAGVSKSLVSLVLRGAHGVSPARRAAVEEAIKRLNYRPNRAAATLAGNRSRTIGVVLDDYRNLWFVGLLAGLHEQLAPLGFRVAVADPLFNAHLDRTPVDGLMSLRVDGIVIATEPSEEMFAALDVPAVVAGNRDIRVPGADIVTNDDMVGGRLATEHLIGMGHRDIGHVTGGGGAARLRAAAYEASMLENGLRPHITRGQGFTMESDGYQAALKLLDQNPSLTAIFAANDTMALGAAGAARDRGLRIPEDLSLIGYDNSPLASANLLRLTTVDGRNGEVGAKAAQALLDRMKDPHVPVRTMLVEPELVVRASTAAPA